MFFISVNIVLILGACVKPVDANIGGNKRGESGVDVRFEAIEDVLPELLANITGITPPPKVNKDDKVKLGDGDTITVTNVIKAGYDTIEWYVNSDTPLTTGFTGSKNETLRVDMTVAPFNASGVYPVTVVGRRGVERYSTLFYINVGS